MSKHDREEFEFEFASRVTHLFQELSSGWELDHEYYDKMHAYYDKMHDSLNQYLIFITYINTNLNEYEKNNEYKYFESESNHIQKQMLKAKKDGLLTKKHYNDLIEVMDMNIVKVFRYERAWEWK